MNADLTEPGTPRGLGPSRERPWRVDVMLCDDSWHATYIVAEPGHCVADSYGSGDLHDVIREVTGRITYELAFDTDCELYRIEWRFAPDSVEEPEPAPVHWLAAPDLPSTIHTSGEVEFHHFPWPCDAYRHGRDGGTRCGEPAVFSIGRVMDTSMPVCAAHLGPVLCHAPTIEWPLTRWSVIEWIGPGERPRNALSPEAADARIEDLTGFAAPPPEPDPYQAGISAKYAGKCTACRGAIAVGDRIFIGYRISNDRKLWVCEACRTTGAAMEHFFGSRGGSD